MSKPTVLLPVYEAESLSALIDANIEELTTELIGNATKFTNEHGNLHLPFLLRAAVTAGKLSALRSIRSAKHCSGKSAIESGPKSVE
jgi:hypothetical protein